MERTEEAYPQTHIVKKTVQDYMATSADHLGRSKNLGQGQADRGPDFVHGIKNVQGGDPWNAARCIHGEPTANQLLPDRDLGKSTKPNCRNVVRTPQDAHRSFGVPTIRRDIPMKDFKSVADYQVSNLHLSCNNILFIYRIMETNQRQLTFCSRRTTLKWALKSKTSGNLKLETKSKVYSKKLDMLTKLESSMLSTTVPKK